MKVQTLRFGEVGVPDEMVFRIPGGLIGFPELGRFIILEHKPGSQFRWLQSADDPELAFVVIDPLLVAPDYPLDALKAALAGSGGPPAEIVVAAIATVPPVPEPVTVNLMAPVVFDARTRVGTQIVLHEHRYATRHVLQRIEEPRSPNP